MFKEPLVTRKVQCFALDEDEVNPLRSLFEQLSPACDLSAVQSRRNQSEVEGFESLKGSDHFFERGEIRRSDLLADFKRQRILRVQLHTAQRRLMVPISDFRRVILST